MKQSELMEYLKKAAMEAVFKETKDDIFKQNIELIDRSAQSLKKANASFNADAFVEYMVPLAEQNAVEITKAMITFRDEIATAALRELDLLAEAKVAA